MRAFVLGGLVSALFLVGCAPAEPELRPWGHCFSAVVRAERVLSPDPALRFFEVEFEGSTSLVDAPCDVPLRPGAPALVATYSINPDLDPWWVFLRYDPELRGCQAEDHVPPEKPSIQQRCKR